MSINCKMSELVNGKSQKKENLLNLSLDATEAEREKSPALQMGYDQNTKRWELIIQYNGTVIILPDHSPAIQGAAQSRSRRKVDKSPPAAAVPAAFPQFHYIE